MLGRAAALVGLRMSADPVPQSLVAVAGTSGPQLIVSSAPQRRWARLLERVIFVLLLLTALALPLSVKGTQRPYKAAAVLWLIAMALQRRRPFPQPLAAPMLAYVAWSAISSAVSPTPILSWDRMKVVGLILVAIVVAQNIRTVRQVKWIVAFLLFSAIVSAGITGWQYLGGYGVELVQVPAQSPLAMAGIQSGDVVQSINGHGVHSPAALQKMVARLPPDVPMHVRVVHGTPIQHLDVTLSRASFAGSGLLLPDAPLHRGRPVRPQGYFTHYDIYAEVMLQFGLLAWGLLLARRKTDGGLRWLLAAVFVLMLLTVASTQTRSAIGAMLLGCFLVMMIATNWKERTAGMGLLLIVLGLATAWIHHTRGFGWIDKRDPGTEYRVMMWQDAARLIPQHPWFGVGMESVRRYWQQWDIRAYRVFGVQWHFHSDYLQLAVERGLPALAAWLWLAAAYLIFLWKLLPRARRAGWLTHGLVLGALGGFLAFLVAGVVQYNLGEEQIDTTIWFLMGLTLALDRILQPAGAQKHPLSNQQEA